MEDSLISTYYEKLWNNQAEHTQWPY